MLIIESYLTRDFDDVRLKLAIVGIMWLFVAVAIISDLVSGWRKARERCEARTSYGLRRTVTKTVLYYAMMLFAFMFDCIGMFFYAQPYVTFIAAGFLIFIEGKSILEKANEKEKRRLNDSVKDISVLLDNKDDLLKGLLRLVKELTDKSEKTDEKNR